MGIDFIRNTVTKHRKTYSAEARRASQDWVSMADKPIKQVCRAQTYPSEKVTAGETVLLRHVITGEVFVSRDAKPIGCLANPSERVLKHLKRNSGVATATVHVVFSDSSCVDLKLD